VTPAGEADTAGEEAGGALLTGALLTGAGAGALLTGALLTGAGAGAEGLLGAGALVAGWPCATSASRAGGSVNCQAIEPPARAETTRTAMPMTQREPRPGIGLPLPLVPASSHREAKCLPPPVLCENERGDNMTANSR
jgi:hypothetical protein